MPQPTRPYSLATQAGNSLFISGQVAVDERGVLVGAGDIEKQTSQVLANISHLLAAAGFTFADVVQVRVYLGALSLYEGMNSVYERCVKPPYPARTTIEAKLIDTDYLVEIEAIAIKA